MTNTKTVLIGTLFVSALAGCNLISAGATGETSALYSAPEHSGLKAVRPYPTAEDVCQIIGESAATAAYLDHTTILIGCPQHETGALQDRIAAGATKVGQVGEWVLLSLPAPLLS